MIAEKDEFRIKHLTWEHTFMAHTFGDNVCPVGTTSIPVTIELPADLPRSQHAVIYKPFDLTLAKL